MIRLASERLRADKSLALIAVAQDGSLIVQNGTKYALSDKVCRDRDVVLAAVKCPGLRWSNEPRATRCGETTTLAWQEIDEALWSDRELVLAAIDANPTTAPQFLRPLPLHMDETFIVEVVVHSEAAFQSWIQSGIRAVEWTDGALPRILRAAADS